MVGIVDETLRDGPQSLWATRMSTASMLPAAPWFNEAGFSKVCLTSGASFETAVKFLRDDPWERLRLLRDCMPDATIDILIRSRNLFGWERYPDEVVELLFRCLRDTGTHWVKIFDGLNDMSNIAAHFRIAKQLGLKASGIMTFSLSPVHTDEYFAAKARELTSYGADSITMGDASGLLTGERTRSLLTAIRREIGNQVPLEFVAHHSMGLAHDAYREALKVGVDTLATACRPLANGESLPSTLDVMAMAADLGVRTGLDEAMVRRADDYFHWAAYQEGQPVPPAITYDALQYKSFAGHQIPGGMMSNFRRQLSEIGLLHRLDEVLEEASRVRAEIGYPVMVTPFSQFVGVQAVFNVMHGERYKTVPHELYLYALGHYGEPPGPIEPNVLDRILKGKSRDRVDSREVFETRIVEAFRREQGPFASDEELLLHLFYGREHVEGMQREKSTFIRRPSAEQPLVVLMRELARQPGLKNLKLEKGSLKLNLGLNNEAHYVS
jgi:pyruvate/oxaloacetate carboxyltransferase